MSISPVFDSPDKRAAILTLSPSGVISVMLPVPTAPMKTFPVLIPIPRGTHGPSDEACPVASNSSMADLIAKDV